MFVLALAVELALAPLLLETTLATLATLATATGEEDEEEENLEEKGWRAATAPEGIWWPLAEAMAARRMARPCGWAFISAWREATWVLRLDDWLNFFSQYGHT